MPNTGAKSDVDAYGNDSDRVGSVSERERVRDVQAMDRHGGCEVGYRPAVFIPVV
jgi:hypothetical protein